MTGPRLAAEEFRALCQLLQDRAGLSFEGSRRDPVRSAVLHRMAAVGCADGAEYVDRARGSAVELQALLDEVTVHETCFFRNPPQIRALRKHVLPELLRCMTADHRDRLNVWSAGCATGEEAYTVAMLARELLGEQADRLVRIVGTDLSTRALAVAQRGRYGPRAVRLADPVDLGRWFRPDPGPPDGFRVTDEVRALVEFSQHNLVHDAAPYPAGTVDLLLCRNVMIYLSAEHVRPLVHRLQACLRPGGYLLLGHAETLWQLEVDLHLVSLGDAFVYRRPLPDADRRHVLPDRRTADDGPPPGVPERRQRTRRGDAGPPQARARADRDLLAAASRALDDGRAEEAARLGRIASEHEPLWAAPHYLTGVALGRLGRDDDALASLRKAVYLDPHDGMAQCALADTLMRLGQPAAAARAYRAAARALAVDRGRSREPVVIDRGRAREPVATDRAELAARCRASAEQAEADAAAGAGATAPGQT